MRYLTFLLLFFTSYANADTLYDRDVTPQMIEKELANGEKIYNATILANVMICEASVEGRIGMLAVANVVLNRVAHHRYPNTIKEVVHQKHQFECITKGKRHNFQDYGFSEAYELALDVLEGKTPSITKATHYYAPKKVKAPFWATQDRYLGAIGNHNFYRVYE